MSTYEYRHDITTRDNNGIYNTITITTIAETRDHALTELCKQIPDGVKSTRLTHVKPHDKAGA